MARDLFINSTYGIVFIGQDDVVMERDFIDLLEIEFAHDGDLFGLGGLAGFKSLGFLEVGLFLGGLGDFQLVLGLLDFEGAIAVVMAREVLFVIDEGAEDGCGLADALGSWAVVVHELEAEDFVEVHEEGEVGRGIGFEPVLNGLGFGAGSEEPGGQDIVRDGRWEG